MSTWIILLITSLLVPVALIILGSIFSKEVPPDINGSSGYKTARSRLSQETWEFANQYFARIARVIGWVLLVLSVAAMMLLRGKDDGDMSAYGAVVVFGQVIVLVLAGVLPTEAALKKNFDENGKRK